MTSPRSRYDAGKRLRRHCPREQQGACDLEIREPGRRLAILARSNTQRLPHLLIQKHRRMAASPFAFFRGNTPLMAADLAPLATSGITVQLCGDAHVRNLGAYTAPDGRIVFDLNDFDETIRGPWEWDVKRLSTSLMLAGEESGQSQRRCEASVRAFVAAYREHLQQFAAVTYVDLTRYLIARARGDRLLEEIFAEARRVTPMRNLKRLTKKTHGRFRFHNRPPDLQRVSRETAASVLAALRGYAATLTASRRWALERYRPEDVAFKLVGTGSVGTRDYVVLLFGNGARDPLFLQMKQELASCYAPYLPALPPFRHQGKRVAEGQQMLQTLPEPFVGYTRSGGHDYLVRQLADHKAALDPGELGRRTLLEYARLCGEVLAKGHARSGDAAALAGYVGRSHKLDEAVAAFSSAYAEQVKKDYRAFLAKFGDPRPPSR